MADFDLTQTGQEVQNILDGAAMQTDLTAEVDRAELAEQTLQGNIDIEETRAKAAEKQNADDIDVIEGKIPAAASDENQLADKNFVNSSIATATATYRGAYNLVSDLSLAVDATHEQIAAALAGEISTADNNDYCFVQIPTNSETPTQIASIERYKFNGTVWSYEYTLNNSGFTADQWAALNSGITSGLVTKLLALPTNDELALALAGKQNVLTFDNVPIENSNNPVKSSGVYSAIGNEETRAKAAEKQNADDIDVIEGKIPAAASDENQLADKSFVNSSIATATATFKGTFNLVNDLSLTVDATHEQIATALAGEISTADNNDYCFVQIPTSDAAPTQIASIERYKFNGTAWAFEYALNNSGFTAAQWAALNSGITSGLVAKLNALPTNDEIILALAGKQDVLTFDNEPTENSNNPVKSGGVYDAIDVEATTRAAAIAAIVALIPEAASALNQLADKNFVNSSISTATAVFKGTFNVVVDLELSYNATQEQISVMLASKIISADNNDYCFVQVPTSDETPLQIAHTDRYKFNGAAWAYEYTLNNSGFTSAQWAAINSGITSLLKDKLIDLPTATELTALLAAKQNQLTFDTVPTTSSTNPVTSGGVKTAIDTEKARAEAAEADRYTKAETYNKNEIDGLVSTPHQNYVTVATYAALPASGSTDTIYRVSSYDGANSQVDNTVYSEYAWDGTQYVFLCVKSQIEEVFDITVYNNNTKYADLAAALGVDGANIPQELRRGGMSVKYVQSSDNKYVLCKLLSQNFNTNITNWVVTNQVDKESLGRSVTVTGGSYSNLVDIDGLDGDIIFIKTDTSLNTTISIRLLSGATVVSTITATKLKDGLYSATANNSFNTLSVYMPISGTIVVYTDKYLIGRMTKSENEINKLQIFDNFPTEGSDYAVKSKGIADRLNRIVHGANIWLTKTIEAENKYYAMTSTYVSSDACNIAKIALQAGDKVVIKGFGYHNPSAGNPWCYKFINSLNQNLSGNIEITEELTENFVLTAPANTAYLILSYYKEEDGDIDMYMDIDRISTLEAKTDSLEGAVDTLNTKTEAIDADYSIDIFDRNNINNRTDSVYRVSAHAIQEAAGYNLAYLSGLAKGETIKITGVNMLTFGYFIQDVRGNTVAEGYIQGDTYITIPTSGYDIFITYKSEDASNFHVYLRTSDFNSRKILNISKNVSLPLKGARENYFLTGCDYVGWFAGIMFNGKEYHFGSAVEGHAPSTANDLGKPFAFEVDANGNKRILDIFGTLESVTNGRWIFSGGQGITRDGNYMFAVIGCQDVTDIHYHMLRELIYVFDKNLNIVTTIDLLSSGVGQVTGNIIETPEHHLLLTSYEPVNNTDQAKVWRSIETIINGWNLTFESVYTIPDIPADEATLGYVNNVLCLITRTLSGNSFITFCKDLEGTDTTKWDLLYNLGYVIHLPAILPYNKNNIFPFAGCLPISATVRVPCICYYDLENRQLLSVNDISNGEIQGWGGYPSFIQIEDGVFAMMYYDDYSNYYSTVFYQRVNTKYKCNVAYFL